MGTALNMRERDRSEEALRQSEARLQAAADLIGLARYSWNPQTNALDWDARLRAMWGLPADAQVDYEVWRSPVCDGQKTLYNEVLPEFQKHGAELIDISVHGAWCHQDFARDRRLHFPLVADFEPKGAVARQYRAYRDAEGVCECALFVLDRDGVIFWSYLSPVAVNPGADGILDALEKLTKREKSDEHIASSSHIA
jgi:peroxiredoxin